MILCLLLAATAVAGFWLGAIPQRFSPLSPLTLENRDQWFVDWKLAALHRDPVLCQSVLKKPYIDASRVVDKPPTRGCGWVNSVKFSKIGNARIRVQPLSCEMAAALTLWINYELQPAARAAFGNPVESIDHMGTYNCRNVEGRHMRSQHAVANAIDISSFTLKGGRQISVLNHWESNGVEAKFLRRVYRQACRYFRVTFGPDYNPAHANHFHFDRSLFRMCR
jgi:hypothetical protein